MVRPQGEIRPFNGQSVNNKHDMPGSLRAIRLALAALAVVCITAPAMAQAPAILRQVPEGSPVQRQLPPTPPTTTPGSALPALPPPSGEVPSRDVHVADVSVDGVTAFPLADVASFTRDLTGPAVPLVKIDAARQAILQHYRSAGYILSSVAAKLDAAGHLRFIVTEGRIASVKLDGDIGPAGVQVLRFLNQLTEVQPITAATLERYLLLAQDVPGITLRAVLQPSADDPGALNLVAQVTRKAVSGLISFDNRAFSQTGPNEGLGVLDLNSFTQLGEKTELSFFHAFPNSENFGQVAEEMFLGGSGLKLRLYAGYGGAQPAGGSGNPLAVLNYNGTTTVLGAMLSYPIIRSRQQTLNIFTTLDALESNVHTGQPQTLTSYDSLRVLRLGEEYAMSDLWFGPDRPAANALSARLSKGLQILGAEANGLAPDAARANENSDFFKINFEATRTQTLFRPWQGASVALMGLLIGQWSSDILPPAEQFYLGGAQFTRGYYSGQVAGDKALAATAELQLNTTLNLSAVKLAPDVATQFYLFYDWGETWQNQSTDFATVVNSAGGGARVQVTGNVEVDFESVGRFNRYPNGSGANVSALNGIGLYWRVLGHF
ncbi:MAG TPA: ShlB/FhaC/HecB family hemolysin secretion/activation protein [Rhodopila sp.]|jgi:hemolysin activation/secretion protein